MRRRPEASQHGMTKPCDFMVTVNDAVAQGKFMLLSAEICLRAKRWKPIALMRATVLVIRQKSAEGIVVKCSS